jgi:hypothetical protein
MNGDVDRLGEVAGESSFDCLFDVARDRVGAECDDGNAPWSGLPERLHRFDAADAGRLMSSESTPAGMLERIRGRYAIRCADQPQIAAASNELLDEL